jgi:Sec-independent protein secretion pathway component TatC
MHYCDLQIAALSVLLPRVCVFGIIFNIPITSSFLCYACCITRICFAYFEDSLLCSYCHMFMVLTNNNAVWIG